MFSCGRNSPIWSVSKAQGNMTQETIDRLATPKPVTQSVPEALITGRYSVSPSAMKANASRRVRQLSKAKNRPDGPYRDPQWPVSTRTCTAVVIHVHIPQWPVRQYTAATATRWWLGADDIQLCAGFIFCMIHVCVSRISKCIHVHDPTHKDKSNVRIF